MRIALFTNNYLPRISGVAVAVDFLERALRGAGHETFVVAPDYGIPVVEVAPRVHRVRSLVFPKLGAAVALPALEQERLLGIVEGFRPDVIHAHHPFVMGTAAADAADAFDIPLVYTFHTLYEFFTHYLKLDFEPVQRRVQEFVRGFGERCDLVVAPTEPIRRYLLDEVGITAPIATVPTGLDAARFEVVDGDGTRLRAALGLERFADVLVWAGRFSKEKNPWLAIETLEELVARGRNASLALFGRGPLLDELLEESEQRGLDGRVVHGGFMSQERLPAALRAGDLFLFTSGADTQGLVLYEAWAAGLPIVAVETMASRALLVPEHNGLFASPDANGFADASERLLDNRVIGRAPFPWQEYAPAAIAARWEDVYAEVAARGRRSERLPAPTLEPVLEEIERLGGSALASGEAE